MTAITANTRPGELRRLGLHERQRGEQDAAEERAGDRGDAADEREQEQEHVEQRLEVELAGGEPEAAVRAPGQPGDGGGQGEHGQLRAAHVHARAWRRRPGCRAWRRAAARTSRVAARGRRRRRARTRCRRATAKASVAREVDAEDLEAADGDAAQPVDARVLEDDVARHLRQRERHERQVEALEPERGQGDHHPERHRDGRRRAHAEDAVAARHLAHRERAEAEEHVLGQRDLARVAGEQDEREQRAWRRRAPG